MEKILGAYTIGMLQDLLMLRHTLERHRKSFFDVEEYIEQQIALRTKEKVRKKVYMIKSCPVCGTRMSFSPVNTGPRNQTGDNSTAVFYCPKCDEDYWETRSIEEIVKDLRKEA